MTDMGQEEKHCWDHIFHGLEHTPANHILDDRQSEPTHVTRRLSCFTKFTASRPLSTPLHFFIVEILYIFSKSLEPGLQFTLRTHCVRATFQVLSSDDWLEATVLECVLQTPHGQWGTARKKRPASPRHGQNTLSLQPAQSYCTEFRADSDFP